MSVTLNDLTPGTLVVTNGGKLAVVTGHKPSNTKYPVLYKLKAGSTTYKGSVVEFKAVVGIVELDDFNAACSAAPSRTTDNSCLVPDVLKGVKIGDRITIRRRSGNEVVTYGGYNARRPKYPVSFTTDSGRQMKGSAALVVGRAA